MAWGTRRTSSPSSSPPKTPARAWEPSPSGASRSSRANSSPRDETPRPLLRVRYSETDAQGVVNNANYLSYFEVGRVEWLRAAGLSYKEFERLGYGIVVVEALVRYRKAAFFDDELTLRTGLVEMSKASLRFEYAVLRDGEVLVTGHTRHACVELATGRPSRMPEQLHAAVRDPS